MFHGFKEMHQNQVIVLLPILLSFGMASDLPSSGTNNSGQHIDLTLAAKTPTLAPRPPPDVSEVSDLVEAFNPFIDHSTRQ